MLLSGWYTEATPNNRMLLSLRSGIDSEIAWALERLCRLCDNEQFVLKAIPGLTDVLFEWPEWYIREGASQAVGMASLFSPHPDQERKRRHALECLFILRNAALNEPNALELSNHARTQPLIFQTLLNIQPDSDANSEFILHAIELLQAVAFKVHLSNHVPRLYVEAISKIEQIAGQSSDRSLIIASLTALTLVFSNSTNMAHMSAHSPAFSASIRYLPLFVDKPLVDACLNYIYTHLSHSPMVKVFLLHPDMPSVLKILVCLLLSEQVEESILLDISGPVQTVPALVTTTRDHELAKEELDDLLPKPEPQRCYDWYAHTRSRDPIHLCLDAHQFYLQDENHVRTQTRWGAYASRLLELVQGRLYSSPRDIPSAWRIGCHQGRQCCLPTGTGNGASRTNPEIRSTRCGPTQRRRLSRYISMPMASFAM